MKRIYHANELLSEDISDLRVPVFLDSTSWREFDYWFRSNTRRLRGRLAQGLSFTIFADELQHTQPVWHKTYLEEQTDQGDGIQVPDENQPEDTDVESDALITLEAKLRDNLGVHLNNEQLPESEISFTALLNELQYIYFHDVANPELCSRHAEFLYLVRRASRNENKIRILTAKPAFQRITNAEIFLLSPPPSNWQLLPANLNVFTELQIHPRIRNVVEADFQNGDYPKVVFQAVNAFRDFVREIINSTEDGGALATAALMLNYKGNGSQQKVSSLPQLLLNDIKVEDSTNDSLVGEQEGFYRFALGVFKAIRNPSAHQTATDPFIQQRFNDQNAAVKVLCLLSMLCERIDAGKRYKP